MRFGASRCDWYDIGIIRLAAFFVYPDKVLDWIGQHTGRVFVWRHVVLLEVTPA